MITNTVNFFRLKINKRGRNLRDWISPRPSDRNRQVLSMEEGRLGGAEGGQIVQEEGDERGG